jgi:UDP:flavonoid glycosyltransferase YjiC (YdhE family)
VYGYSPLVVPKPPDWGEWIHVCGYWFLDAAETYQPPDDLIAFLQSGPPPVYVGFGSMIHRDPARVAEMAVKALAIAQQRGILLTGWAGLNHRNLPDHVFQIDAAPHDWLFPRTAAVVHHGGAGTAAAGLRAGVPSIVVPFFADQHFWGERAHALGVGPKPIPQKQLTAERLAEAIHIAVTDQAMRARAADLGRRLQAEDGVGRAVEVIQDYLTDIRGSKSSTL